jgi:hypothetical protein
MRSLRWCFNPGAGWYFGIYTIDIYLIRQKHGFILLRNDYLTDVERIEIDLVCLFFRNAFTALIIRSRRDEARSDTQLLFIIKTESKIIFNIC